MAELGQTTEPRVLVPGDPETLQVAAASFRSRGAQLQATAAGLRRIDTAAGWRGPAADAFRARFDLEPGRWQSAADAFDRTAGALSTFAAALAAAQQRAATAVRQWDAAQDQPSRLTTAAGLSPAAAAARQILEAARADLAAAGDTAARTIGAARDEAPGPGVWTQVRAGLSVARAEALNLGGQGVNALASAGNAAIENPEDVLALAAGAGLMTSGASGNAAGLGLDATGAGAVAGVPLNVASTAAMTAGGGLIVAGGGSLIMHASGSSRVTPARTDHTAGSGPEISRGYRGGPFDRDEMVEFANGHTGDRNPIAKRPTPAQIEEVLTRATPERMPGQNSEKFVHNGVRVVLNYDQPWRSTANYLKGQ